MSLSLPYILYVVNSELTTLNRFLDDDQKVMLNSCINIIILKLITDKREVNKDE